MRQLFGLSVLLVSALLPALSIAADRSCDRDCLQKLSAQYMSAVAANDVKAAPLMVGYRQTQNTKLTHAGTGIWGTITAVDSNPRFYLDPVNGQVLWFGTIDTTLRKQPEVTMVRLKVVDRQIAEAEWFMSGPGLGTMRGPVVAGGEEVLSDPEYLNANKPAPRVIPAAQRLSRAALEGIANSYFDGLSENDGSLVLAHPDCFRLENGGLVTGRPLDPGATDGYEGKTNCTSRFEALNISLVADRRFFAVDEEQQVVATSAIFMRKADATFRRCVFHEIFYIDGGRISKVYSAIYYPGPNESAPNWPPYQGNFPLPASFGEAR